MRKLFSIYSNFAVYKYTEKNRPFKIYNKLLEIKMNKKESIHNSDQNAKKQEDI